MPQYSSTTILRYLCRAAELVFQFVECKSFTEYDCDAMLRSAVERQLIIVGESVNWLYRYYPLMTTRITDYPKIIAFRNRAVHMLDDIDNRTVWWIVNEKLPITHHEVLGLLQELEDG